jgi:hypothetical protein
MIPIGLITVLTAVAALAAGFRDRPGAALRLKQLDISKTAFIEMTCAFALQL